MVFFQYEAALAVDAIDAITRALNHMMKDKPDIFKSTIRRTKMYNQNKTQGIPCTYPNLYWEHGDAIIEQIKMVRSFEPCENLSSGFPTRCDINQTVQLQKMASGFTFRI